MDKNKKQVSAHWLKPNFDKAYEKGVHAEYGIRPGWSQAGHQARRGKEEPVREWIQTEDSKQKHKKVLKELKAMPKPNLGKDEDPCWDGYKKVPGKKDYSEDSCVKKAGDEVKGKKDEEHQVDENQEKDLHQDQNHEMAEEMSENQDPEQGEEPEKQGHQEGQLDDQDGEHDVSHMMFVAMDGDDIGQHVGSAILNDDLNALHEISNKINEGQEIIKQFASHFGGHIIAQGGDEANICVPQEAEEHLESLREEYKNAVGASLSVGVGSKPSEAGKALIVAKLHGKDQILHFEPEMDQFLDEVNQGHHKDGSEEQKMQDHYLSHMDQKGHSVEDGMQHDQNLEQDDNYDAQDDDKEIHEHEFFHTPEEVQKDDTDAEQNSEEIDQTEPLQDAGQQNQALPDAPIENQIPQADSAQPSIKDKMLSVIEAFKENKQEVDQAKQNKPELYQSYMEMLSCMIKVAKIIQADKPQEQQAPAGEVGKPIP